jgi:hypothetical protein
MLSSVGLVLCGMVVVLFFLSLWWQLDYLGRHGGFTAAHGHLVIFVGPYPRSLGWSWGRAGVGDLVWLPAVVTHGPVTAVVLPYWLPFLLVAGPSLLGWLVSRARDPTRCRECGYDLTGNVSGNCPECGTPRPNT